MDEARFVWNDYASVEENLNDYRVKCPFMVFETRIVS